MSVDHYENFPVASILCPPALRPAVAAIYWYARTADDLADEGDTSAAQRLADLARYRDDLQAAAGGRPGSARWAGVFGPLAATLQSHALPVPLLEDLLDAFVQDVQQGIDHSEHADRDSLLAYCRCSANPIGRLLLHLYGVHETSALRQSDAICTALQLINFWQDLSIDLARQRRYLPLADCRRHGLQTDGPRAASERRKADALVQELVDWTRATMLDGAPLVHHLPGRLGWELRLVVQGGLRILDQVEALRGEVFTRRPKLSAWDGPGLLWRALRM